jgi:hypothetical protein
MACEVRRNHKVTQDCDSDVQIGRTRVRIDRSRHVGKAAARQLERMQRKPLACRFTAQATAAPGTYAAPSEST